jgi:hypothetical protein
MDTHKNGQPPESSQLTSQGLRLDIPIAVGRPDANNDQHYPGETVFTGGWS